ncbi:MAG: hypothetical protein OXH02_03340 [Gemmatimonadetes bacterium]|nr:hypothetical protein [Gemmatimonadota bacterium]
MSAGRRIQRMHLGVCAGYAVYRHIGEVVHAQAIDGIEDRQSVDMAGNTGTAYAFVIVVVIMGRRRDHEESDGENRGPTL